MLDFNTPIAEKHSINNFSMEEKTPIGDINFDKMNDSNTQDWEYIMLDTLDIPYSMEDEFDNPDDMDEVSL